MSDILIINLKLILVAFYIYKFEGHELLMSIKRSLSRKSPHSINKILSFNFSKSRIHQLSLQSIKIGILLSGEVLNSSQSDILISSTNVLIKLCNNFSGCPFFVYWISLFIGIFLQESLNYCGHLLNIFFECTLLLINMGIESSKILKINCFS